MKLLTMEQITGEGVGERDWCVVLETEMERETYRRAVELLGTLPPANIYGGVEQAKAYNSGRADGIIEGLLTQGLGDIYCDSDIYYYFLGQAPEVGEEWENGGITFKRVA